MFTRAREGQVLVGLATYIAHTTHDVRTLHVALLEAHHHGIAWVVLTQNGVSLLVGGKVQPGRGEFLGRARHLAVLVLLQQFILPCEQHAGAVLVRRGVVSVSDGSRLRIGVSDVACRNH